MLQLNENLNQAFFVAAEIVDSKGIQEKLFPVNVWVYVAHFVAFIAIFSIVVFLIWKPTRVYLAKRRAELNKRLEEIETNRKLSDKYYQEANKERAKAQEVAQNIIFNTKKDLDNFRKEAENQAVQQASLIHQQAVNEVKIMKSKAQKELNNSVSEIAILVAEKLIEEKLDPETNKKFIDQYLNQLEK